MCADNINIMIFSSIEFIFFFIPAVYLIYQFILHTNGSQKALLVLVVASFAFYSFWSIQHLLLFILSITINYFGSQFIISKKIANQDCRVPFYFLLTYNLSSLGFFKYADFLIFNINRAGGYDFSLLEVLLPLGISFYTFQQISYVVDCRYSKNTYSMFYKIRIVYN